MNDTISDKSRQFLESAGRRLVELLFATKRRKVLMKKRRKERMKVAVPENGESSRNETRRIVMFEVAVLREIPGKPRTTGRTNTAMFFPVSFGGKRTNRCRTRRQVESKNGAENTRRNKSRIITKHPVRIGSIRTRKINW